MVSEGSTQERKKITMNTKTWKTKERALHNLKVKKLHPDACLPTRGTPGSAGLDLYAIKDVEMRPGDITAIHSGIAVQIPWNYCGLLMTRSSFGKQGVRIAAGTNCIDADYRGEIIIYLRNDGEYPWKIHKGDRVAQLVIVPYFHMESEWAEELSETKRGANGFGSTGR